MGNILCVIMLFAIGWILGVHLPWWGCLVVVIFNISFAVDATLEEVLFVVFTTISLTLGMVIGGIVYGDLGQLGQLIDFKFLFTGI